MMTAIKKGFLSDQDGSTTIEFVTIFFALVAVIFFVLETTLYMFFTASLEKAAQAGVRAVVVSTPVVAGIPARNGKTANGVFGVSCNHASAPCISYGTQTCTGIACSAGDFNRILTHVKSVSGKVEAENITIRYQNTGLGYAGGPVIPLVSISISNVPYETGILGLLLQNAGVLSTLPSRSASMTGEDLG